MTKEEKWETKKIEEKDDAKSPKEKSWLSKSGQLAVDIYSTENDIVVQAPVAGVKKEDLDIVTEKDIVIIKGKRERPEGDKIKEYFVQECFYGDFQREIILPEETDPSRIDANIEESVLTIKIPKIEREKKRKIDI